MPAAAAASGGPTRAGTAGGGAAAPTPAVAAVACPTRGAGRRSPGGRPRVDDHVGEDLVGERLLLGVPQREQPPDEAGQAVDDVQEVAADPEPATDGLPGALV